MERGIEVVNGADPAGAAALEFTPGNVDQKTEADLNALEAQINAQLQGKLAQQAPQLPVQQQQPQAQVQIQEPQAQPQGVVPPTDVPQKFQNADGSLNEQKLDKSLANLNAYVEAERELTRLRQANAQGNQFNPQAFQQPQYQPQQPQQGQDFVGDVQRGLQTNAAGTVVNLFRAAQLAAEQNVQESLKEVNMKMELMSIAQEDPVVFTKQGLQELIQIRKDNPWVNDSPSPWLYAYRIRQTNAAPRQAQPQAPQQVRRPAPILGGGQQPPKLSVPLQIRTVDDLNRHVDSVVANLPPDKRYQARADYLEKLIDAQGKK